MAAKAGGGLFRRLKEFLQFRPEDPGGLLQVLPQREANVSGVERIKGYRYPAPGSRTGARVPVRDSAEEVYDIKHYSRDPRNVKPDEETFINSAAKPVLLAPSVPKIGSPGNKNPAVLRYDPSGLRSSMSANWAALDASLEKHAKPNHLPAPAWFKDLKAIEEECEKKGIPYVPGRRFVGKSSVNYNAVRW